KELRSLDVAPPRSGMMISGTSNLMDRLRRISLSFASLLLAVTLFTLLFSLLFTGAGFFRAGTLLLIFRVTVVFARPVWCLWVPLVIALKDAEERRIWTIFLSGIVIGPASLALWGLILQLRGGDPHRIWQGDPLIGLGGIAAMIFSAIVGFLTTSFYVIALKILHRRSTTARGWFSGRYRYVVSLVFGSRFPVADV